MILYTILAVFVGIISTTIVFVISRSFVRRCKSNYRFAFIFLMSLLVITEVIYIASFDLFIGKDISFLQKPLEIIFLILSLLIVILIILSHNGFLSKIAGVLKLALVEVMIRFGLFSSLEYFGMIPVSTSVAYCKNDLNGTFIGKSRNLLGNTILKVNFNRGRIESIEILRGNHSKYGRRAFEKLPAIIVETQNANFDAISGATRSSNLIKSALGDACRNAYFSKKK